MLNSMRMTQSGMQTLLRATNGRRTNHENRPTPGSRLYLPPATAELCRTDGNWTPQPDNLQYSLHLLARRKPEIVISPAQAREVARHPLTGIPHHSKLRVHADPVITNSFE